MLVEQFGQRFLYPPFTFLAGQIQEMHILLIGPSGLLHHQGVVSPPVGQRRIQIFAILVAGKRPGLANQPADDVPIVDGMLVLAAQARHPLHQFLSMPHLDLLRADPRLDLGADQPRRYRVGVVLYPNGAAAPHARALPLQRLQPLLRQRPQGRQFRRELRRPAGIPQGLHARHQLPIFISTAKITAAAQQQRLRHRILEMPMRRLHIAVLMTAVGIGRLGLQTVMPH
jgi:hypothetical protein